MKRIIPLILLLAICFSFAHGQQEEAYTLRNPFSTLYLEKNIKKKTPRIIITSRIKRDLQKKIKGDPVAGSYYAAIKKEADDIMKRPVIERRKVGRRMLGTSRDMLNRMNLLGMVYLMEGDRHVLNRINDELIAVSNFIDWNPPHFLDVAEMAMAVAIGLDWTEGDLPEETISGAKDALVEKALKTGFEPQNSNWVSAENNWNQVCHGGMIAAAVAVADEYPELAAKTLRRAMDNLPVALDSYKPDGVYPEGPTYWSYGTSFTLLTISILESAFGDDFGIAGYPGFMESATFMVLSRAPSGWYFNFADCGDKWNGGESSVLAWFAAKTGRSEYFDREMLSGSEGHEIRLPRYAGAALAWVSAYEEKESIPLPLAWKGDGQNPVVIFRDGKAGKQNFYLGAKGGRGVVNHGNMDGGSFVFELDGVRWVVDPGNQNYHELEKTGFDLWGKCQECERWKLLTKNNYGHSTLTVNNRMHNVDGMAEIVEFVDGEKPQATIDMSQAFKGQLKNARRTFTRDSETSLIIEDEVELNENTELVTWQLMTTADISMKKGGAILSKDGKQLKLEIINHPGLDVSVVSLDPPPLEIDRRIEDLKRIEIRMPAYIFENGKGLIRVRLSADR